MTARFRIMALLAGISMLTLASAGAHAQSIDYSGLEQMFGEPVTTSVTGTPQRVSAAPAPMSIVTQDDIRRSGASNIPDVLQFVNGIDTRRYGFGQDEVAVRGYASANYPRILVLVNGRQVYLDDYGYVDWNAIPIELGEIRQIEVVMGPSSALFGFNAAAGVINIITYDPLADNVNEATIRGGTQDFAQGEAVATLHPGRGFGVRVSAGSYTAREFGGLPGDFAGPQNARANMDARWQINPRINLRLEGGISDDRHPTYAPLATYFVGHVRSNDIRAGGSIETRYGLLDLDAYRNQARALYPILGARPWDITTLRVVRLADLFKPDPRDTIRIGLEYRNNAGTGALFAGTTSYDDYAATTTWSIALSPRLSVTNAVRLDDVVLHSDAEVLPVAGITRARFNHRTITAPSFNSSVMFQATPTDTVRLTLARGLQIPSLLQLGIEIVPPGLGLAIVGQPDLAPTATWNLDLGLDHEMPALRSMLTVDGFLQRNTNLNASPAVGIFLPDSYGLAIVNADVGSSNEAGLEIGIKGNNTNGLRWNASYRLYAISDDVTSSVTPSMTTSYAGATPTSAVIAGVGYKIDRWAFDLDGRWQSSYRDYVLGGYVSRPVRVGDYVTFAGRIGYALTSHVTLAGSAQQFNLSRTQETAGIDVERRFIASVAVGF